AIALIGKLPATLSDRSINVAMRRKGRTERVERLRFSVLEEETAEIRRKVARWAADNRTALRSADPSVPDALNDRAADCWRPLLSVADRVGGSWPELARKAAVTLSNIEDDSTGTKLLTDVRMIFKSQGIDRIFSEGLAAELGKLEGRPWAEWGKSEKPITKNQLARQLKPFDIVPGSVRIGDDNKKGYKVEQFEDAFSRYVDVQNVTTSQPAPNVDSSENSKRHTNL